MNTIDLIYSIKKRMYIQALEHYRKILYEHYGEAFNNEYVNAIRTYQSLSDSDKQSVFFLLETAIDDTICNFLSWIDGVYFVSGQKEEVILNIGEKRFNINGELSDIWKNLQEGVKKEDLEEFYGE